MKTLDYRQSKHQSSAYEEWNYFDNITNASCFFDEEIKMTVVRCSFRNVAYLMSDTGKTIEKIVPADVEELGDTEDAVYNTLFDAANAAMEK